MRLLFSENRRIDDEAVCISYVFPKTHASQLSHVTTYVTSLEDETGDTDTLCHGGIALYRPPPHGVVLGKLKWN